MAKDEAITAATLAKVAKLLELRKELIAKLHDCTIEIDNLLGGKAGIGEQLKAVTTCFDTAWGDRYAGGVAGRYVWARMKDIPQIKRLLKMLGLEELQDRIARYLQDEDPFVRNARHPFGLLVSRINSYAAAASAPADLQLEAPTVSDCKHRPACKNDQEHTRRKMRELQGE